jgi:hypothetical protein
MGVVSKTVLTITCDNPNCPGNSLNPKSFDGWLRVNAQTQLTPAADKMNPAPFSMPLSTPEQIYCSAACSTAIQQVITDAEEARKPVEPEPVEEPA